LIGFTTPIRKLAPLPQGLIANGAAANLDLHGGYRELRTFAEGIKRVREAAAVTSAEVSRRCGIDQPTLSRLENGHNKNPMLDTPWRYAATVDYHLVLTTEAICDTRLTQGKVKRVRAARER
jgi:DNA-binding XRE family transcriptional regulator